jgi:P pilus assembly chaperone PapD
MLEVYMGRNYLWVFLINFFIHKYQYMKSFKSIFSFLFCAMMVIGVSYGQGLELSPVRFDFQLEPGSAQSQTLTVRNTSNQQATYTLGAADWYLDEVGNVIRKDEGNPERSCAGWLSFSPALVELEPNASQEVTVNFNVPAGENKTKWAIAYVTLQKEQEAPAADRDLAMGIEVNQAIGVFITQSPRSNQDASAELKNFQEVSSADGGRVFTVETANTGDKILECNMYLVVSDLNNAEEKKYDPIQFKVLPGGSRIGELSLSETLKPGSYLVATILDYGPNFPLEGAQMQLEVK